MYICTATYCVYIYIHNYIHTCIHTCIHTHTCRCLCGCVWRCTCHLRIKGRLQNLVEACQNTNDGQAVSPAWHKHTESRKPNNKRQHPPAQNCPHHQAMKIYRQERNPRKKTNMRARWHTETEGWGRTQTKKQTTAHSSASRGRGSGEGQRVTDQKKLN